MTQKPSTVRDDLGTQWIVAAGDPGYRAVEAARELRLRWFACPSEVLLGYPAEQPHWKELVQALEGNIDIDECRNLYTANLIRQRLRNGAS